ncbi:class I SAM-dependent methyltransferase [Plesiomonas shigelloides]|uniref:class I SAM-dependent methyltransferase n=1 Tax=Plesiomonas shigelloides TaxID=703 RepID=UPI0022465C92|nr:methyltransferase domain-containing protein [Plesiomonas shigelloides]MCX2497645.1 methyltransferase domain-containing protein [Plesiomonas shigelloides]
MRVEEDMQTNIWGLQVETGSLTESQKDYLKSLPEEYPSVEWVWEEMDRVWNLFDLDNTTPIANQNVGSFYGHPVWIMNGLFTEVDSESVKHRKSIAEFINQKKINRVADYGGGSGVLADQITRGNSEVSVDIVEPYSSPFFINKLSGVERVEYVHEFSAMQYDCVIAQDVLEHVDNPVETAYKIACNVRDGGVVIFANCFYPVIKCHLPHNFYLRHTFKSVMRKMGLSYEGSIPGAEHAQVFTKNRDLNIEHALMYAGKIKSFGFLLNYIYPIASKLKNIFK